MLHIEPLPLSDALRPFGKLGQVHPDGHRDTQDDRWILYRILGLVDEVPQRVPAYRQTGGMTLQKSSPNPSQGGG